MASNKLYGLPTRIELKTMRDPTIKQKTETFGDHGQAIYMNTTVLENGKIASVEDKDHDYEILHHKFSPPNRNLPAEKNLKHGLGAIGKEYRCVFIVFGGMMCALFFMVTGVAVALGVLHKTGELQHSWEPWAPWSPCSVSCDVGISLRKRNCSNGDSKMGFTDCVGDASEYQLCKESLCNETYILWSAWEQWSLCSASCDVGMRHRRRNCNETSSSENAVHCIGDATEYQLCNVRACSVNGMWGSWSVWGLCSTTCNTGVQIRQRACSNPKPTNDGDFCLGDFLEHRLCYNIPCSSSVVNGGWSSWVGWGTCSTTCGPGLQTRQRTCSNPRPMNGGEHCFGDSAEYRSCDIGSCPRVNGGWSLWSSWGTCSTSCGSGLQTRSRSCSSPRPSNGGEHCFGGSTDYQSCKQRTCPAYDGYWSTWSTWSSCSSSCTKSRSRTCTSFSTYGRVCIGNSEEKENCNVTVCALPSLYVRLDGYTSRGSRLEVSLDNYNWGTVCDDGFDADDVKVACRMLGLPGSNTSSYFTAGNGTGPIYLDDLDCSGYESSLMFCKHGGWGKHNCQHYEDVGVSC